MVIQIYYVGGSPPCRAVMMTLKALDVPHEIVQFDFESGGLRSEEYLKKNPQHTIPTIEDGDFILWDSHAINQYLVDKYSKGHSLYPIDLQKRAVINQRLFFDCGVLFTILLKIDMQIMHGKPDISKEDWDKVTEGYEFVEKFLERGTKFIASDELTIADFSVVSTLTTLNLLKPDIRDGKYPLTASYLSRCKSSIVAYDEVNESGLKDFRKFFSEKFNYKFS